MDNRRAMRMAMESEGDVTHYFITISLSDFRVDE